MIDKVKAIMNELKDYEENRIDFKRNPIPPYKGDGQIRLIIIGQDPTVKKEKSRDNIRVTLNLDKDGGLKRYIVQICDALGLKLENVYATNVFKYFYTTPPAKTPDVLSKHLTPNKKLLEEELSQFPGIPIIILGEPILKLLTNEKNKVRLYWGYKNGGSFSPVIIFNDHICFTFPHQPSLRKVFYKSNLDKYLMFVKDTMALVPIRTSDYTYGNGVVVGNKLITAGHVVTSCKSFHADHNYFETKDALILENQNVNETGEYYDVAVFNYSDGYDDLTLSELLPSIGEELVSYSLKRRMTKEGSDIFAKIVDTDELYISKAIVREIIGNFIFCDMSDTLEEGRSGSPLIKDGKVYGILHGGVDGSPCAFLSSVAIKEYITEE